MKYLIQLFVFLFVLQCAYAQKEAQLHYSKLKINLAGRDIKELDRNGIETDHGIFHKNRYFISDFSEDEIAIIKNLGFDTEIIIEDVVKYYQDSQRKSELSETSIQFKGRCDEGINNEYNYVTPRQYYDGTMGGYFTYQEMTDILDSMAKKYPNLITVRKNIGNIQTIQGNSIFYVKVSDNPETDEASEPKVLYTALHHAREPISLTQMIFYLWYLLENYNIDPVTTKILNETQMFFIPCVNPDGYILNQTNNPEGGGLWRKNMWRDSLGELKGVDLNRNYGYYWGFDNSGSSENPNSNTYRGPGAFSESENMAVRQLCLEHDFEIGLNYHSFGNYLIHPWGYNDTVTSEDRVFKTIGKVMNRENSFLMGTGSETVGYTTNGDSDDWMYGEQGEKQKIYSFTPEVGPSFWPAKTDINYLNRSCLWMNFSTALLTLNYYEAEEINSTKYLSPETSSIYVKVHRAGLKDGTCSIKLKSETSGVVVLNPNQTVTLELADVQNLEFALDIDVNGQYNDGIRLVMEVENDGVVTTRLISKLWLNKSLAIVYSDSISNTNRFISDGWESTELQFVSSPSSITDSANGNYLPNTYKEISLKEPLNLKDASHAFLNFYAKWDIEAGYDYVQVLASKDNVDFIPLCGKYTKPGGQSQIFNSPLYDGIQNEWVFEEMDLKDFAGSANVWIKFTLTSDQYAEKDGFYFDDLTVKAAVNTVNVLDNTPDKFLVYPNLLAGDGYCLISGLQSDKQYKIKIKNQTGQVVREVSVYENDYNLDVTSLSPGMYFLEIYEANKYISSAKLVIVK